MKKGIEVGDTVNVYFAGGLSARLGYKVLYTPCATGDVWSLSKDGNIIYVQMFSLMEKVEEGE